ncbi:MAG TPA: hypothetical protein PLZ36_03425 [Armatimonadota bacterium]|nr:hypothetical protein [Armatimonadota bacterium]HOS43341.1 hypothetical protein [Armatimonadota bacterium]
MGCLFDILYYALGRAILSVIPARAAALLGGIGVVLGAGCWYWGREITAARSALWSAGAVLGIAGAVLLLVALLAWTDREE